MPLTRLTSVLALACSGATAFAPTPFADGVLANLTAGPRSPFCSWTLSPAGVFSNSGSGLCLAAADAPSARGPVYLSRAACGNASQAWTWVGAEMDGGLMFIGAGARGQLCVTGVDPRSSPLSELVLAVCAFGPWQQLTSDADGNGTLTLANVEGRDPLFVCSPGGAA
jgi:hypothetical protein